MRGSARPGATPDGAPEQPAQARRCQHVVRRPVAGNAALVEQHDAGDLGHDVGEVVRDEDEARAPARKRPHRGAHLVRRAEVQARHRLVENQRAWFVDERAADQQPAPFARRHPRHRTLVEVREPEPGEHLVDAGVHLRRGLVMRPETDAAEERREQQLAPGDPARTRRQQVVRDDADGGAQVPERPAVLAEHGDAGLGARKRIELARDDLEQRALAGPVGAEHGDMLVGRNDEREIVEHRDPIADDGDV